MNLLSKPINIFFLILFCSCMERFAIPDDIQKSGQDTFGAGDTTYLMIQPIWNSEQDVVNPVEISIAQDGRIFVADEGQSSILVFDQSGNQPDGFEDLRNLVDNHNNEITPIDVDIDKKMNVFYIDGSQRIFVWNQYWNEVGINKVSSSATFVHFQSGADTIAYAGTEGWLSLLNDSNWEIVESEMITDLLLIDSLLKPHLFYDGANEMNMYLDTYYQSDSSKFTGLTTPSGEENMIFVTDNYGGYNNQHRIVQIDFFRSLILELSGGDVVWAYEGRFGSTIKGYGTGAGTVNSPTSIDVDYLGNVYYTQSGDYFPIHMISPNLSGDFAVYNSGFQPEADDIMNPSLYLYPVDIAVDNNRNSYIVDQQSSDITVFNFNGSFFKKAGYINETEKIMNDPVALTVDNKGVIYVCDSDGGAIYRYKLSNSLDEDLNPEE